jgi:hypothetical protein
VNDSCALILERQYSSVLAPCTAQHSTALTSICPPREAQKGTFSWPSRYSRTSPLSQAQLTATWCHRLSTLAQQAGQQSVEGRK